MVDDSLERREAGASNAFGFSKKYSKLRKCEKISDRNVQNVGAFCSTEKINRSIQSCTIKLYPQRYFLYFSVFPQGYFMIRVSCRYNGDSAFVIF